MAIETEFQVALPSVPLLETDGEPLETLWHRDEIGLLIESLAHRFRERTDYFVGGNMFIYFSEEQARNRDYRGPDFFYVSGVRFLPHRPYWAVWQEDGRYPDVIIELLSPSTAEHDRTVKKALYERTFRTPEYFLYDPATRQLEGWRLSNSHYRAISPNERGWLWSEELEVWVGGWTGRYLDKEADWLRFYDAEGRVVPIRAEAAEQQVKAAEQQVKAAEQQVKAAEQRAEAAEAELARLQARLAELETGKPSAENPTF